MENQKQRFKSIKQFAATTGVPENLIRREVKQGIVPGFYSGSWFHVDAPAYLAMLSTRNTAGTAAE